MSKIIIFKNIDGSCGVVHPTPKALLEMAIEDIAIKDVPSSLEYRISDISVLPESREFRNAWTDHNPTDTVDVDIVPARLIHMENIRIARNKKLLTLDIETLKGNDVQTEKQVLRDLPANTDLTLATTPEELKVIWPTELN